MTLTSVLQGHNIPVQVGQEADNGTWQGPIISHSKECSYLELRLVFQIVAYTPKPPVGQRREKPFFTDIDEESIVKRNEISEISYIQDINRNSLRTPGMNIKPFHLATGLFLLAGFMTLTANAGKVFKWIDERGTTHYSSRPPKIEIDTQVINMSGVPDEIFAENSSKTETDADEDNSDSEEKAAEPDVTVIGSKDNKSADVIAYCQKVKNNLRILESEKQVQLQQEDGTIEILGNEAREREMKRLRDQRGKFCA